MSHYTYHLKKCALEVVNGNEPFDRQHPYCNSVDFVRVLISEFDRRRLDLQAVEDYEQCAMLRDSIADLETLLRILTDKSPPP